MQGVNTFSKFRQLALCGPDCESRKKGGGKNVSKMMQSQPSKGVSSSDFQRVLVFKDIISGPSISTRGVGPMVGFSPSIL